MTDHPPTLTQIASTITRVTDNVARARRRFGLWRTLTRGQIKRGEEYLDASHTIFHLCRPLMYKGDKVMVRNTFKRAKDAKARLKPSNVSRFQRLRDAKQFKSLCKETFEVVTDTSRRLLGDSLLRTSDGTDPPDEPDDGTDPSGRTGLVTLCIISQIFQAGVPPTTPGELNRPQRTVNSRTSRYSALPRRKYADSDHLGVTEGIASLNIDDASVQGGEVPTGTAGPPPGPSLDQRMTDRAQEADCVSHISSQGLGSEAGADDC
ncbi:hypothetical protein EDB89DRAFT_2023463 [Lactarius sanguifluus]|nr:hypothetical protein EDB89DRAFT_2023463 [Lactarius sanguifluus]